MSMMFTARLTFHYSAINPVSYLLSNKPTLILTFHYIAINPNNAQIYGDAEV